MSEARRRLKLQTPYFLRLTMEHAHPRVYSTNRLSKRGLAEMYGPFPSRAAAERYCDAVLDLFKLRRCWEDLEVSPEHPGCVYGEMKKCMAPCKQACTAEEYAAEARAVKAFFETRGESLLAAIGAERERASEEMDFERAAELHVQWEKVKAAAGLADELVRPVPKLRAVIVQAAAHDPAREKERAEEAAVFLLEGGCLAGPERLSTLGVRAVREQTSVGLEPVCAAADVAGGSAGAAEAGRCRSRWSAAVAVMRLRRSGLGGAGGAGGEVGGWRRSGDAERSSGAVAAVVLQAGEAADGRGVSAECGWQLAGAADSARSGEDGDGRAEGDAGDGSGGGEGDAGRGAPDEGLHEGRPDVERVVPVVEKPADVSEPAKEGACAWRRRLEATSLL